MTNQIAAVFDLEPVGEDRYTAQNVAGAHGVVFGGQLLGQALMAAAATTVPAMQVKSMHTVFARGASTEAPLEVSVARLHAGRSFASVEVSIAQGPRLCTRSLVLLHQPDDDLIRGADEMPTVEPPTSAAARSGVAERGWEVRVVDDVDLNDPDAIGPAELFVWSRFAEVPDRPCVNEALLAYASDGFLIGTAMRPHAGVGQALAHVSISTSVITQTLTFHETFDAGDWLLLAHRSPYAGRGRSFGRADVFCSEGRLVASYQQENMIRAFAADRRPAAGDKAKY
jgi:acyl-CoA thioesterase-2